jgi:dTMP kinase
MNVNSGILICFVGIDGSGKSTLAKTLIENMSEHGLETEYTWGKFESSLLKLLIFIKNKLFVREEDWKKNYEISLEIKKNLFKKRFAYILYECFVLLDYRFQIIRKIAIPLKRGKNLVCDRYIYDTIVDLAVDLGYSDEKVKNRIDQLLDFSPKPDLVFLEDLPEDVAFSRKDDVPSLKFLYEKRKIYKKIKEEFEMIDLDGTKSLQELNEKIEREVVKLQIVRERCIE